ncbi:HupE/UreJ family protein [Aureibaculum conchae]|uniref:HupE/UreJ family protein n=1 Tax=Aureibaculum sp. 2308TA14-22 TaxID=3108392 RepID=UPI0033908DDE
MEDFILYLKLGLYHVLDWEAYDHIWFLVALAVIYNFNNLKKVIWLVTLFTIGHTLTLALAAYKVISIDIAIVEFLIPVTIFITAVVNILTVKKELQKSSNINLVFALVFGLIHGLGFSNYFRMLMDESEAKLVPLLEFALGIEIAQVIIVMAILTSGYVAQYFFKVSKRDWVLVLSSIVIGVVIPMLSERIFW